MSNNVQTAQLSIVVISDSIGETAQRMVHATLSQFPELNQVAIKKFPFIQSKEELMNILELAVAEHAIVITTLVNPEFLSLIHISEPTRRS